MSKFLKTSSYFPLQVSIDDRESVALEDEFRKLGNMIVCRQRMDVGDYLLDSDLLVERKTIPDFCHSIKDGRLFKQAKLLATSPIPAIYILEGRNRQFKDTDFTRQAIQGILISLSLAFRLPIIKTKNYPESVQVMLQCFKQLTKDRLEEQRFFPQSYTKKQPPLHIQRVQILKGFPGVGVDRAERMLAKFDSLYAVFTAENEALLNVPGLGKKTVDRFLEILRK
ncbi:ERCC4 domain-containing protein [Lunatibacter salilacus]|uniref:ERCC4 domain-containing protein n=1 Tax=Lunatibacter salilacus TaxID=2483804 RepID=UPI00131D3972|nr:ERCC4 domain-containing protein [Lunatibacter salilacus]